MSAAIQLVPLDSTIQQQPEWCAHCGGLQTFVEVFEFDGGRLGFCLGCGDERVARFTRTTES